MDPSFQESHKTDLVEPAELPGSLPTAEIAKDVDHEAIASSVLNRLNNLDADILTNDALWRDAFALTGTLRTINGAKRIVTAWKHLFETRSPSKFTLIPETSKVISATPKSSWIDAMFSFETAKSPATTCSGMISLVPDADGNWRIWLLRTMLEQLTGYQDVDKLEPQLPTTDHSTNGTNGSSECQKFGCVVIGGGQAGLAMAGRLKALDISYVVIDRNPLVGDCWALRYDSIKLHTPKAWGTLPFDDTFLPEDPLLLPKQNIITAFQKWVKRYNINMWMSTTVMSSRWDEKEEAWKVQIQRNGDEEVIYAHHLVFAIGSGCEIPTHPIYPNMDRYKGIVLHSANYKSAVQWKGKAGIIIGSGNTAHDVADDMLDAGLSSITMVQRSPTYVLPVEYLNEFFAVYYNDDIPTELADRLTMSIPLSIGRVLSMNMLNDMAAREPDRFDALERANFKVTRYGDLWGLLAKSFGKHYMDVGTSAKIAKGLIKMKSNALPVGYTSDGLEFSDGEKIKADVIFFATGFGGNMRDSVAQVVGSEIAKDLSDWWGIDEEGELKGAWKPCGHKNMWYAGGSVAQARFFSRFIALQVKAELVGTPFEVYTKGGLKN